MHRRVVVTGMGVVSPVGLNVKEAWKSILTGKCGITKLGERFENLPCKIGGLICNNGNRIQLSDYFSKSELRTIGQSTGYALLAAKQAVEDAKLQEMDDSIKSNVGVAIGVGMLDLEDICMTNEAFKKSYKQLSPYFAPRILANMPAGQISIRYGFRGPNHVVSTACASGAHAIGDSFRFILNGDADIMVCGAAEACISPLAVAAFCRLRALSTSHNDTPQQSSRPFDKLRDGFVMGEGSAVLVLEELEHALRRNVHTYAEILGYGLSGDASHMTAPHPEGIGALLAMKRTINNANLKITDIGYINAHATSTPVGDAIEIKAIKSLFNDHSTNLAVSSTKGAHGHLLGAAGALESVFTVKAVEEGVLPPTINLENSEEKNINLVPLTSQAWDSAKRIALKNSFGFGGTNACLCISQFS